MDRDGILWVLEKLGARNVLPKGQNVQLSCPLAGWRKGHKGVEDGKPSMGVMINPRGESLVHCFACQFGGSLENLVLELHRLRGEDLTDVLLKVSEMEEQDPAWLAESVQDYDAPVDSYEEKLVSEMELAPMMGKTHRYLLDRGVEIETLKAWRGGFDEVKKRVIFPVRRRDGGLVGAVGRAIHDEQKPKYLNYFAFDKGRYLFGEHLVKAGTAVVVCEGLLDAVCTWQALGKSGLLDRYSVVSFLGANATVFQLRRLVKYTDEVILFLDNDPAGWSGQLAAAKFLQDKLVLRAVRYPTTVGGDPASLVEEGVDVGALVVGSDLLLT